MHITKSISGKTIRLPDERWVHIVKGHPEMARYLHDVLLTVAVPDMIVEGGAGELLAAAYQRSDKVLVVVYKEIETEGFILTAYFTKKMKALLKRNILWQR
ncbi:hypothetical protein [Parasediminibacterium sp. JCM 36343]|uniref:hypothetical protein n=1 Tax=Parasediminibacterium sp. JCM 36343 TaxID=3374279 RepID=UPI00397C6060